MYTRLLSIAIVLMISISQLCYASPCLQEEQIKNAVALNSSSTKFEDYLAQEKAETENDFSPRVTHF